jgi:chromosomal replication initiator protein
MSPDFPMSPNDLWQTALGQLRLQMTRATFDTWLKSSQGLSLQGDTLVIGVPNAYAKDWIEQRLEPTVQQTLTDINGRSLDCSFVVAPIHGSNGDLVALGGSAGPEIVFEQTPLPALTPNGASSPVPKLNPRYTFETFVVGSSNRMAHAAAQAVAEQPAGRYNPLFIYGGVGLGKTHLLHAIGHAALGRGQRVLVVSSEKFTNDLINAIRTHSTDDFRSVYRVADVLLIDDIHFIAGKESTQEEFFHTFNAIYESEGQIVMTSDRPPQSIATLEDRLRSRFQWGLQVDVEPPDLEMRIAILRGKNEQSSQPVPDPIIEIIAQAVQQNVRELEGALNRVIAYAQVNQLPLTVETARKALADLTLRHEAPALDDILRVVAAHYGLGVTELSGRGRSAGVAEPRQVAMYLMREETDSSFQAIGGAIGGRDHTTVLHGWEKISRLIEQDPNLRRDILRIRETLYSG